MRQLACLTTALLLAACVAAGDDRFAPIEVGAPVPAYATRTLQGDTVHVGGAGPVTLVNVWATWCTPCEREFPELQRLHERYAPRGLRVLAVSIDQGSDAAVERFVAERGATFAIGRDPAGWIQQRFMTIGVPETFLVGADGTLLWRRLGELVAQDSVLERQLERALP